MTSSQLTFRVWRVEPPAPERAGWTPSGNQKSGGLPPNSPSNPGGATPTMVSEIRPDADSCQEHRRVRQTNVARMHG